MIDGQGFRFEPEALHAFGDAGARLAATVAQAHGRLTGAGALPAGIFGEVGETSGFVAAYGERAGALATRVNAIAGGMDGLATAVRSYVDAKLRQEEDAAAELRRAEERV